VRYNQFDKALENNHTLASVLKVAGYATAAIGKWGLQGGPGEKSPAGEKATPGVEWRAYEIAAPWVAKLDDMQPTARGVQPLADLSHAPHAQDFAMFFTGLIEAPADGEYTFAVQTDTGALLRIHEATVLDFDRGFSAGGEVTGAIRLQKGAHPFRLYYRHHGAESPLLTFRWSRPGTALEDVPATVLFHDPSAPVSTQATPSRQ
jgi:hypothetical protein